MKNLNILLVIDSLEVGGAESQLVMLATELQNRGYRCEVFALRGEGAFVEVLRSRGISIKDGKLARGRDRLALVHGLWLLWRCIFEMRPCVVHTFLPLSNFLGSLMARSADAAVVITSRRGLGKHQEWNPRWKIFDRISNALSDAISVNSNAVGVDTVTRDGVDSKKIICVYNGLDLSRFGTPQHTRDLMRRQLHLSGGEFAWVKVANLIDYKGHQDLLLAFAELLKTRPARLFLVGRDRGSQGSLESATALLGIADRVHFLGDCGNVPEILSAMDGYVMASHTEGFSNAILEAMAAGLPIIATAVGGNVEALQNGKLGFLVEPHDPTALAGAMSQMMINQPLRENLSILAAKTVRERYSVKAMVESYIRLYQGEFNR